MAILALCSTALLVVAVVLFLVRNANYLVLGLVGLAVVVGGGWWLVTERRLRRAMGIVGLVLGAGVIALAVFRAATASQYPGLRVAFVGVLLVTSVLSARSALVRHVYEIDRGRAPRLARPEHPVLICNPWSGGGKVTKFGLAGLASELGVETVMLDHGLDLEQLARDAIARGADCLGMAGGDGSQALVASIAIEHDLPFVCVAAGTRNHFALDLGLDRDDPRKSLDAFRDAVERRVDYAKLGDRLFVNNVSLGVYATIVQQEEYRDAKVDTSKELLPDLLGKRDEPFDLQFTTPDGTEVDGAFLILVSNNPYVLGVSLDASERRRLDSGKLGVVAISAATGREAAKVVTLSAIGQQRRSRSWHEFATDTFEVRSRSGKAFAGIDGEALELPTPLEFRIHPGGLRLLVPERNVAVAERRWARDVNLRELRALATARRKSSRRTSGSIT